MVDERKGRKVAETVFGLSVIGTVGVLLRAKQKGLIPNVRNPIDRILASGYFIHQRIVAELLKRAGEDS